MGRPWEYSRRRNAAMQAVMWLLFLAVLGAAQLVSRSRSLDARPAVAVGEFLLHLPPDWSVRKNGPGDYLLARDPAGRELIFIAAPLRGPGPDEMRDAEPRSRIRFRDLHCVGSLEVQNQRQRTPQGVISQIALVATARVPNLSMEIAIGLKPPDSEITAEDESLLQRIADSVSPALGAAAGKPAASAKPGAKTTL